MCVRACVCFWCPTWPWLSTRVAHLQVAKSPAVAKPSAVQQESSERALEFLSSLGLDLGVVVRLGGHSAPRTHSNPSGPNVGMALVRGVEGALRRQPHVRVITSAAVTGVAYTPDGRVAVTYTEGHAGTSGSGSGSGDGGAASSSISGSTSGSTSGAGRAVAGSGQMTLLADGLVLATGGFAASHELLTRYAPPGVADLPSTNGAWATGDGLKLGQALGAATVQLEQVQVHPTGFVDPKDPGNMSKVRHTRVNVWAGWGRQHVQQHTCRSHANQLHPAATTTWLPLHAIDPVPGP